MTAADPLALYGHPDGDRASLLPLNVRSALEEAASLAIAGRYPLPTHLVKDVMDPAKCPPDLLKYYAAGLGLEIWHEGWSDERKRDVCSGIWLLKRRKTKLKGIAAYLRLVDASLVSARRPKDKRWWTGGQTPEQRAATIAEMPQVRVYPYPSPGAADVARLFWGARRAWGAAAFEASDAPRLWADRARYVDPLEGVDAPVTVAGISGPVDPSFRVELRSPAPPQQMFYGAGKPWGASAWVDSVAARRVVSITPDPGSPAFAVPAGLLPMNVAPVPVAESYADAPGRAVWGASAWGARSAWAASSARAHVYQRFSLYDPSRPAPARQPYSAWGWSRWGQPAYEAEVTVDVDLSMPAWRFNAGRAWGARYAWGRSDLSAYWDAVFAVRTAKAYRDVVWVDTTLYTPIQFTPGLRLGEGDFQRFGDSRKKT